MGWGGKKKIVVDDDLANAWKSYYEEGHGQDDMVAYEAARGRSTSWLVIRREIVRMGGAIRTFTEQYDLRRKNRMNKNYRFSRKPQDV